MTYVAIPASGGSATLTTLTGLTDKQVVFGSSAGAGTSSADLTYDDTTNDLALSVAESGGTVGGLVANTSNTASSAAQFKVQVAGATAANPSIMLSISGVKTYDWRIDNANSDRLDLYFDSTRIVSFKSDVSTFVYFVTALEERFEIENTNSAFYTRFQNKANSRSFDIYTFGSGYGSSPFFGLTGANGCMMTTDATAFGIGNTANAPVVLGTNNLERFRISGAGLFTVWDGGNVALGTVTGTKIGTATSQLLGFYNATPVDQPATVTDPSGGAIIDAEGRVAIIAVIDRLQELGLIA